MRLDLSRFDQRLERIEDLCGRLDELAARPWDAIAADAVLTAAMEHFVQVAIQSAIDAAAQVVVAEGWPVGGTYGDVFRTLADRGVLDRDLASRLSRAAGLRNVIVHDYLDLDDRRVHSGLARGTADLRALARALARHARRTPPPC
ncbi:DUF86 domain-containing protein [Myxococcota bacterium]|nr:DUF86 domain-containing protein [Myxococcota bacterium]